jgi:hypothetical protein
MTYITRQFGHFGHGAGPKMAGVSNQHTHLFFYFTSGNSSLP